MVFVITCLTILYGVYNNVLGFSHLGYMSEGYKFHQQTLNETLYQWYLDWLSLFTQRVK